MKNCLIKLIVIIVVAATAFQAAASEKFFSRATAMPDVTSVYVGPAMLRMSRNVTLLSGVGDIANFINDIKSIEIVCGSEKQIGSICEETVKTNNMELLSEVQNQLNSVKIYGNTARADRGILNDVVLLVSSGPDFYAIYILGKLSLSRLMEEYEPLQMKLNRMETSETLSPSDIHKLNEIKNNPLSPRTNGFDTITVEEIRVID